MLVRRADGIDTMSQAQRDPIDGDFPRVTQRLRRCVVGAVSLVASLITIYVALAATIFGGGDAALAQFQSKIGQVCDALNTLDGTTLATATDDEAGKLHSGAALVEQQDAVEYGWDAELGPSWTLLSMLRATRVPHDEAGEEVLDGRGLAGLGRPSVGTSSSFRSMSCIRPRSRQQRTG